MKTEDIEYNGQIFSCRKIIDISSMVELLSLLAKRQQYLEDKLNFQEERINDKDKRISELEIMLKGISLSKEEKFPSEKEMNKIKKEVKNESDDDLYSFLNKDNIVEEKNRENDLNEILEDKKEDNYQKEEKPQTKEEIPEEKYGENNEENNKEKQEEKDMEKNREKNMEKNDENEKEKKYEVKEEEKHEEKKEKKDEEKIEEKPKEVFEEKPEEKSEENKDIKADNKMNEVIENEINMNLEQKISPTLVNKPNLADTENKQISSSDNQEKIIEKTIIEKHYINTIQPSQNQIQTKIVEVPVSNSQDAEMMKKIIKRIKLLEEKIDKLQQMEVESKLQNQANDKANKNKIENNNNKINTLNNKIEQLEGNQKNMKDEMEKIKVKAEDFNVYDLIKNNTGGDSGNIDVAKGLVMNLETKVFKKMGFNDQKFKKIEEEVFQNKKDIQNLNNLIGGLKETVNKNTQSINDLKNIDDEKFVEYNNYINEINKKIKDINTKINMNDLKKPDNIITNKTNIETNASNNNITSNNNTNMNNNNNDEIMRKIKDLETKLEELNNKLELHKLSTENSKAHESAINQEQIKIIKDLSSRIKDLEKNMKMILSQLNIKEVYDRLEALEKDMILKGNKYELNEIKEKIQSLEESEKDTNFKMDQNQQFSEKIRGDMQNIIKKIEFLSGQINRISNENADNDKGKGSIIDTTKLVDINMFNEKNKEISKKFDKVRLSFEEVARNMDDIIQKLSHVPSDKDFSQFQSIIKTMIEELKLTFSKKYADKTEINKSIKFLETQIKSIQESFQKKMDGADNWLLAKKPLNNYVCASCESIIKGELDRKSEFVPWNKYPNREEKSYRYGHGFSRMLQLINEDRKKELKEKDSVSDGGSDSEPMFKLPKLKRHHINSGKIKTNNNVMSDDENNVPYEKRKSYKNELDPIISEERPKIMKIIKRNKNVAQSTKLFKNDKITDKDNLAGLIIKTIPNSSKEGSQIAQTEVINVQNNEE